MVRCSRSAHRLRSAGLLAVVAAAVVRAASPTPAADASHTFNSELAFEVCLRPLDSRFQTSLVGWTPSPEPLEVPADDRWYIRPRTTVDATRLRRTLASKAVPGLSLSSRRELRDLAALGELPSLRRLMLAEVKSGRKRSHWMWYVFPQFEGLGYSATSRRYSIKSRAEAEAYLRHPVLGPRLTECVEAALALEGRSAYEVFGSPDDLKLKSCATLFASVSPVGSVFERLLEKYFQGARDRTTLRLMGVAREGA